MTDRKKRMRFYICMGLCLVLLFTPANRIFATKTAAGVILFLESGKILTEPATTPTEQPPNPTAPPAPTEAPTDPADQTDPTEPIQPALPLFSAADASLVQVNSYCGYEPDVQAWLENPLSWNLTAPEKTVLILHSHATEGYADTKSNNYRSEQAQQNMVAIGDALAARLEKAGIGVVHDRTLHDYPSYSDAYANSREAA